jgi:hypothetical protein
MHSSCVQAVFLAGEALGQVVRLCSLSTGLELLRLSIVRFLLILNTGFTQKYFSCSQFFLHFGSSYRLSGFTHFPQDL